MLTQIAAHCFIVGLGQTEGLIILVEPFLIAGFCDIKLQIGSASGFE
jgi:hypothetical protein